ncbi:MULTISPECIES: hypothetical protein [unclassified Streptomyces]|uniref:hypothetical protein n=1 Tax=unclassified Streptomyces TaxID=2593676 RepID=UPI00145CC09C|nr:MULTISPECIES: hypothetical protein [unclassified Streptomyces]NMI57124.1 hypothetical protein [Streptomyces sp. RLA2-12]
MRWLLLGALLGLLIVFPPLLALVAAAAVLAKPVLVAFGLGLAVRTRLPRLRRRVR